MKHSLLTMVQDVLYAIDAESVQDVDETPEAQMVVNILNRAYESMISSKRWRHLRSYANLVTTTNLNELLVPSTAIAVDVASVWYAERPVYYLNADEFIALTIGRDETASDVTVIDNIKVKTGSNPVWFTSDDDEHLIFDAIPDAVDGLASNDSLAIVYNYPQSRLTSNTETFDLPAQAHPALENLALSYAIGELKGDSAQAQMYYREHVKKMGSLSRNARLIDRPDDRRKHIVPRRTRRSVEVTRIIS